MDEKRTKEERIQHRKESVKRSRKELLSKRKALGLCRCGRQPSGTNKMCDECSSKQRSLWKTKAKLNRSMGLCGHCGCKLDGPTRCPDCTERKDRERKNLKKDVLNAYGGRCACCGETNYGFLTIDHKEGGGSKHRKEINNSIYRWLRKNGYPTDLFEVLCFNCNMGRQCNGGICPHKCVGI